MRDGRRVRWTECVSEREVCVLKRLVRERVRVVFMCMCLHVFVCDRDRESTRE